MKLSRLLALSLMLILSSMVNAQFFDRLNPSLDFAGAAGISSYYGDLAQPHSVFREPSYCLSAGVAYNHNPHLSLRTDFSFLQVQAHDSKNSRADLKARNLSFKSEMWELNATAEYNVLDITGDNHKITPYAFIGFGVCHFNPYTTDRNGKTVYLQPQGTEGQGLAAYPDRKPYATTILQIPLGGGVKYAVSEKLTLALELKYRYIDTDYLDDVSNAGYPDPSILAAKNVNLPMLTYRADELPGGNAYTKSNVLGLNRGNPNNRDAYYSFQFKVLLRLKNYEHVDINY